MVSIKILRAQKNLRLSPALDVHAICPPLEMKACTRLWMILLTLPEVFTVSRFVIFLRILIFRGETIAPTDA